MSRDQRPGKIRVVSSGKQPAVIGPSADLPDEAAGAAPGAETSAPEPSRAAIGWGKALLFLGGCAAGGAGFAVCARIF